MPIRIGSQTPPWMLSPDASDTPRGQGAPLVSVGGSFQDGFDPSTLPRAPLRMFALPAPERVLSQDDLQRMMSQLGGFQAFKEASESARGYGGGSGPLAGLTNEQKAQTDRYVQGMYAGADPNVPAILKPEVVGTDAVLTAANETVKLSPWLCNNVMAPIFGEQFRMDETSSNPSLGNVTAGVEGLLAGWSVSANGQTLPGQPSGDDSNVSIEDQLDNFVAGGE
jgi:hypothetical protein